MKKTILVFATLIISVINVSCNDNDNNNPNTKTPGQGTFIDHGQIPATLQANNNFAEYQTAFYDNGFVYVATSDGIWKNNLATKAWTRSGLDGKGITAIYKHPTIANKYFAGVQTDYTATFKTMYYSTDAGATWTAANTLPYDSLDNKYENFYCFAVRPNNPNHIYCNIEGTTIAVSTDGGINWTRMNGLSEPSIGYRCNIAFRGNDASKIYQGSENPLDDAWVANYTIGSNPSQLSNFTKITSHAEYGNRRPVELLTFPNTADALYVGQEGALSKISGSNNTLKWIFKKPISGGDGHYPYVYGIWVDPTNSQHLLFGGQGNGGSDMELYETYNEGATVHRFTDKMSLAVPQVMDIISTNTYPAILVDDRDNGKVKLLLYKPN